MLQCGVWCGVVRWCVHGCVYLYYGYGKTRSERRVVVAVVVVVIVVVEIGWLGEFTCKDGK